MNSWKYTNGISVLEYTSFPYAFRAMYLSVKKELEKGNNITKSVKIISPIKDQYGDLKRYSYDDAVRMAKTLNILNSEGMINNKNMTYDRLMR